MTAQRTASRLGRRAFFAALAPALALALARCAPRARAPVGRGPAPSASAARETFEPARPTVRYLALGDSFTAGTGIRSAESFPAQLAARWRREGHGVLLRNAGANGRTSAEVLAEQVPELEPFAPTAVTYSVGANDVVRGVSLEAFRANVRAALRAVLAARVDPRAVWVLPQPDWSLAPTAASMGDPARFAAEIERFNSALRAEADAAGVRWVELFPLMRRQYREGLLAPDRLHLREDAYFGWIDAIEGQPPSAPAPP